MGPRLCRSPLPGHEEQHRVVSGTLGPCQVSSGRRLSLCQSGHRNGKKDRKILLDLRRAKPDLYYFPVDMSPEMLRIGIKEVLGSEVIPRSKILPIQIDFSSDGEREGTSPCGDGLLPAKKRFSILCWETRSLTSTVTLACCKHWPFCYDRKTGCYWKLPPQSGSTARPQDLPARSMTKAPVSRSSS